MALLRCFHRRQDGLQTVQTVGIAGVGAIVLTFGYAHFADVRKPAAEGHNEAYQLTYNSPAPKSAAGKPGGGPGVPPPPLPPPGVAEAGRIAVPDDKKDFRISADPKMPALAAAFSLAKDPKADLSSADVRWKLTVSFDGSETKGGLANAPLVVERQTRGPALTMTPEDWGQIRGGKLLIEAVATWSGRTAKAKLGEMTIKGSNAAEAEVAAAIGDATLEKIARHEIRSEGTKAGTPLPQFGKDGWPIFNRGGDGGAGLMQLTPAGSTDRIWNWRENVAEGKVRFEQKRAVAGRFPARVQASDGFAAEVKALNASRKARKLAEATVLAPAFTSEQKEQDAVRGYNGFNGRDWLVQARGSLHEFRLATEPDPADPKKRVLATVAVPGKANVLNAVWERVPVADRPKGGEPNYVNLVLGLAN